MIHCVYGHDAEVAAWVARQLNVRDFGKCVGIGIANNQDIIGGAVYNNHHLDQWGQPLSIEMSFATLDKHWSTRGTIRHLLDYPFGQLRVERVQLTISRRNKKVRKFVAKLGFTFEGYARKAHHDKSDAAIYSMLKHEWINSKYGKISPLGTAGTRPSHDSGSTNAEQQRDCAL